MIRQFSYVKAASIDDAVRHLAKTGAFLHAGGTDLLGCMRDEVHEAETLVSIRGLDEMRGIGRETSGELRIGALTTIDEISRHEEILASYPALAQAARSVGSPQLRNQGTLGGNLCQRPRCWYFRGPFNCAKKGGDLCYAVDGENTYHCIFGGGPCYIVHPSDSAPALTAYEARARLTGPSGSRWVPLEEFYRLPDESLEHETVLQQAEILTEILIPPPAPSSGGTYRKVRARQAWDFALASAAVVLELDDDRVRSARIVLGGVAPIPWRSPAAEAVLVGQRLQEGVIARAAKAAVDGAEPLAANGYKVAMVKGILEETLAEMMSPV